MINPPNNNKFIGLQDQQTLGQLNDPLQAEQDFLAKRMSQPVPVPGDQSPMMQTNYPHARVKQRAIQPLMPMPKERIGKVEEAVVQPMQREVQKPYRTGYERIVRNKRPDAYELKPDIQQPRFEQVPQKTAPFRQDDPNKGKPYVVNERPGVWQPGTEDRTKDTLFLPKSFKGQKGKMIGEDDYIDNAKVNKDVYFQVGVQDLEDKGKIKIRQ